MFFTINIYSKNLNSLNNFLKIFNNKKIFKKLKIKFFKILYENPVKKKKLTILKSPHVNKKAQEQFEHKIYKKKLLCFTEQPFLFLIMFKVLRFKYFSDAYVLINFQFDLSKSTKIFKQNFNFKSIDLKHVKSKFLLIDYLKVLELKGEFLVNKI